MTNKAERENELMQKVEVDIFSTPRGKRAQAFSVAPNGSQIPFGIPSSYTEDDRGRGTVSMNPTQAVDSAVETTRNTGDMLIIKDYTHLAKVKTAKKKQGS